MSTDQFIQERRYLKGVTQKTLDWYQQSFRAFSGALDSKGAVMARIAQLRERGVKPVSVNTWLRCVNAYFRWLHTEHQQPLLRISKLKEEQKIISTFTPQHIDRLIDWRPTTASGRRLHMLILTALDTGLRVNELLTLRRGDVDLDNLHLRVTGKGQKERLVPISLELRKGLYRWLAKGPASDAKAPVFGTARGGKLGSRNLLRDFKRLCKGLGISGVRCSFHTLRHTMATQYLRSGGNVFYLQRILGHSDLAMTNRYVRSLGIEDLKEVHSGLSVLSRH